MSSLLKQRLLFGSLIVSLALTACGVFRSSDDEEPIAPAPSGAPTALSEPLPVATAVGAANPGSSPAAPVTPSTKPDGGAQADASLPADAGKGDAGAPGDAGAGDAGSASARLKACAEKCQAVMQACLTPSFTDSGVPQIKDPAACQAAAEACRAGCAPK
jgi:hypothetical protein